MRWRRPALLGGLAALHVALALLMWRAGVTVPAAAPVVYANLLLLPVPRPVAIAQTRPVAETRPIVEARPVAAPEPPPLQRPARRQPGPVTQPAAVSATATRAATAAAAAPDNAAPAGQPVPAPALDLAAMRASAGEHERRRVRSGVELVQEEQRVRDRDDSDGARAIKKAGRADCTKAYSGGDTFDPLKLIPLIYDTVTDTGCKW